MANSDSSTMQRARRRHLPCTKMVRVLICSIALLVPTLALALVTAQPAPVGSPTTSGAAPGGAGGAGGSSAGGNSSTPIDCAKIFPSNRNESFMAHGPEVDECMHRAADAPVQLRPNNGEGPGVRIGGAGGFSYGTVQAPESPPGEQKANASIGRDKILAACNFPPRVKIGIPGKVTIPSGTCLDFLNGVFKDKDGLANSAPAPAGITPAAAACPAESDTSGAYGTKVAITGSSIATPCGGLVPTSTSDQSLSVNASHLATTVNNAYFIWVYQKSGNQFALKGNSLKLPSYLCRKDKLGIAQKTVDLTAPMEQMITYNPSARTIAIRLRSRATMNLAFIPEFDPSQPEKYLVLPLNAAGDPEIPGDCADEATYWRVPDRTGDIEIQAATQPGCETPTVTPTQFNAAMCPDGKAKTADGQCLDATGKPVAPVNNFVALCPGGIAPDAKGICPQAAAFPANPSCSGTAVGATSAPQTCDTVTIKPAGEACAGKLQYGVLNRPGLYYPSGSSAIFYPIAGRSALMAQTSSNSKLFAQGDTLIRLQPTAPALTFDEGGSIALKNGATLLMNPPASIDPATARITLTGGGQLINGGGVQLQSLKNGEVFTIPSAVLALPYEVRIGRSVTLPAGFLIPTSATQNGEAPYVRLPADAPK